MDNDWWGCASNHGAHDEHAPNPPQAFGYDQGESEVGASDEGTPVSTTGCLQGVAD